MMTRSIFIPFSAWFLLLFFGHPVHASNWAFNWNPWWGNSKSTSTNQGVETVKGYPGSGETEGVVINDRLVSIGGIGGFKLRLWGIKATWETVASYDPATGKAEQLADLPFPLHHTAAVADEVAGKIYVFGGHSEFWYQTSHDKSRADVLIYDVANDSWSHGPDMPEARFGHDAVWIGSEIYIFGGDGAQNHGGHSNSHGVETFVFDPQAGTWDQKAPIPTLRHHVSAFESNGLVYVLGGRQGEFDSFKSVEVYDPTTDVWSTGKDFPKFFNGGSALNIGGEVYAFGGEDPARLSVNREIYRFDASKGDWSEVGKMLIPRHAMAAGVIGGKAYLLAGTSGAGFLSPFTPSKKVEWFIP